MIISSRLSPSTYSAWLRDARPSGEKFGSPPQLDYPSGNLVCVHLLVVGVLEELLLGLRCVYPCRHVIVALVPQHANDFRRKGLIQ